MLDFKNWDKMDRVKAISTLVLVLLCGAVILFAAARMFGFYKVKPTEPEAPLLTENAEELRPERPEVDQMDAASLRQFIGGERVKSQRQLYVTAATRLGTLQGPKAAEFIHGLEQPDWRARELGDAALKAAFERKPNETIQAAAEYSPALLEHLLVSYAEQKPSLAAAAFDKSEAHHSVGINIAAAWRKQDAGAAYTWSSEHSEPKLKAVSGRCFRQWANEKPDAAADAALKLRHEDLMPLLRARPVDPPFNAVEWIATVSDDRRAALEKLMQHPSP